MPSKSKNYNILQSVETVNLDDGVEAVTQPRKPRISPPFRCTKRVRFLAVIGILVSFVAVLLIVTFSLVAVIVGRNDSGGGGIGPTSSPPPVHCKSQPSTRFACKLSGGQVITTERDCLISGCCWNSTLPTKCFSGTPSMCPSELSERLSCSNLKDELGCTTGGCCWDNTNPNTPCFRPFSVKCPTVDNMRFNCIPELTINQSDLSGFRELCTERSCCWNQQSTVQCSYSVDYGYTVSSVKKNSNGWLLGLTRKPNQPSLFGQEVDQLGVEVTYETDTRLHVRVRMIASAYSLHTHSIIHSLTHSLTHSLGFMSACQCMQSAHSLYHSLTLAHSFSHSLTRLHVRVLMLASACSLHIHSIIHSHSLAHSLNRSLTLISLTHSLSLSLSSCLTLTLADTKFLYLSKRPTNKHRPNHPWLIPSHSQTIRISNFK